MSDVSYDSFFLPGATITGVHKFSDFDKHSHKVKGEMFSQSHPPGIALSFLPRQPVLNGQTQERGDAYGNVPAFLHLLFPLEHFLIPRRLGSWLERATKRQEKQVVL